MVSLGTTVDQFASLASKYLNKTPGRGEILSLFFIVWVWRVGLFNQTNMTREQLERYWMLYQLIGSITSYRGGYLNLSTWQAARELRDLCGHAIYYYTQMK